MFGRLGSAGHVSWWLGQVLALILGSVPQGFTSALALDFEPTEDPGAPSLPIQPLNQHGADHVGAVLDFHQQDDVTAFDDLCGQNSQVFEAIYYK